MAKKKDNEAPEFIPQDFIRKTANYNPVPHMIRIKYEPDDPDEVMYLAVSQRLDWFQHWCAENNHSFRIDESQYEIRESLKLVIATCVIYVDGEEVAKATASREYTISNGTREVSNAVQTAFTFAKGRALADYGFGTVNGNAAENGDLFPPDSGIRIPTVTPATNPMMAGTAAPAQKPTAPAGASSTRRTTTVKEKIPTTLEEAQDYIIPCGKFKGERVGSIWGRGGKDAATLQWFLGDDFTSKDKYPALIAACELVTKAPVA